MCSLAAVATVLSLVAVTAVRQSMAAGAPSDGKSLSASERRFVTDVAKDGTHEVEVGKLALKKYSNDSVKRLAQRLVDDHSKANQELTELAAK